MHRDEKLIIGNVTYIMRPANFDMAWAALKAAGALFKGLQVSNREDALDVGVLLGNLGDPAIAKIEQVVIEHTNVQVEGDTPFKLSSRLNEHFNDHRGNYIPLMLAGIRFQYADFFAGAAPALAAVMANFKTGRSSI